ncbi:hypothetical protein B0H14DRAFT_3657780 [Mycena olivaceomarginata]|nr:hypothetical protein B0H14DRAFT_3657780 [Mycena olivaceomarginata]
MPDRDLFVTVTNLFVLYHHISRRPMHEDLQGKNTAKLPLLYRVYIRVQRDEWFFERVSQIGGRRAENAARPEGTSASVYYRNLDITGIPTPDQLDSLTEHASVIERAALALQELAWCGAWAPSAITEDCGPLLELIDGDLRWTMVNYQWSPEITHLPHGTPGVRVVMGRAWGLALQTGHDMQFLASDLQSGNPANIQEYVEGAGGPDSFAALVLEHIEREHAPVKGGYTPNESTAYLLSGIIRLLREGDDGDGSLN